MLRLPVPGANVAAAPGVFLLSVAFANRPPP
jgi:hypothetical protein